MAGFWAASFDSGGGTVGACELVANVPRGTAWLRRSRDAEQKPTASTVPPRAQEKRQGFFLFPDLYGGVGEAASMRPC